MAPPAQRLYQPIKWVATNAGGMETWQRLLVL